MAYTIHNFEQGDVLYADQLNEMDAQIAANEESIENSVSFLKSALTAMNGENEIGTTNFSDSINVNGATAVYEDGKIKVYDQITGGRYLCVLNGQKIVKNTTSTFSETLPVGTYKVNFSMTGFAANGYRDTPVAYTTSTFDNASYVKNNDVIVATQPIMIGIFCTYGTDFGTVDNPTYFELSMTEYDEKLNKKDVDSLLKALPPTGDTSDRTSDIVGLLNSNGICKLEAGDYYISNVTMPDSSCLVGEGDLTKIYFTDSAVGSAISMGSRCTVSDLTIYGANTDIILPSSSDPDQSRGNTNYLENITWNVGDGYMDYVFPDSLNPGTYTFYINATTDTGVDIFYACFMKTNTYSASNIIQKVTVTKNEGQWYTITSTVPIKSIFLFAAGSVSSSSGFTITINEDCQLYTITSKIGDRYGIKWEGENNEFGIISNCRIEHFTGGGILARDTNTPVDRNLSINNCFIRNCVVGIYIQRNSEFMKICNNTIVKNYWGILNRGGNNNIANCGIDANIVNVQIDNAEGHNGGHGAITGCSLNHADGNTGYSLIIRGTGRELVEGCNIYYGKILLENTNGNIILGCGFGNSTSWEINGGACSIFANCIVKNADETSVVVTNNTAHKFVNCYTRAGVDFPLT